MQGWMEPVGPDGARTYWLRRAVLAGAVLALVVGLIWWFARPAADAGTTATPGPTPSDSATPTAPASPSPTGSGTGEAASGTPEPETSESAPAEAEAPASPDAEQTPTATPSPIACRVGQLTLGVTGPEQVPSGEAATFTVDVASDQAQECLADLTAMAAEFVVTSGNDRIWSTGDCPEWQPNAQLVVRRDAPTSFQIGWPGHRSAGCQVSDDLLGAGTYVGTARIGDLSGRFVFQVVNP